MEETKLSQNQKVLLTIRELKARIKTLESNQSEPIAVIGIGCRFPGDVTSPESFWQLLLNKVDAITEVPADRWNINEYFDPTPGTKGKMYTRWGGFLANIDQFDPQFFGISPREAASLDPQQRLLLEVAWEAMERAGQNPKQLEGTKTGVFIGITASDYAIQQVKSGDLTQIDAYFGTGNALNAAAGRLSYIFGFHGPSMIVDTACSSSLVAIHLACQSLRNKESDLTLAGGVNLILTPESTITTSQAKMLSPSGRCKTFDASADGYVRGEGCGIVVLKRLSDAIRDRDTILGLVRSSAVNQDGQSAGFTVPNGLAQQALIREALDKAGIKPAEIGYIEAHGTGTVLGDPIEVKALQEVFGKDRDPSHKLVVGSVKTNIGHLESASGIAGFIKTLLVLQHREIPAHLHLKRINPHIAINAMPIAIPADLMPWTADQSKRLAGVSAFGFSGTNAHIVLEEAPDIQITDSEQKPTVQLLTISAKSKNALLSLVNEYRTSINQTQEQSLANFCYTSNHGRSHFRYRVAIAGKSAAEIEERLAAYSAGKKKSDLFSGDADPERTSKTVFLFTGQGAQYAQMGKQLYQTQPVFRYWLDECDRLLQPYLEKPLLSVFYGDNTGLLDQTAYTQPALFALEYSLYQLWLSWGIQPDAVTGHSVGEYVAACVAGIYNLADGLKLIAARGKLMQQLPAGGEMMAVFASEQQVADLIEPYQAVVSIASVNAPQSIVISGSADSLAVLQSKLESLAIKVHRLIVSHAFHSPLMASIMEPFGKIAAELEYHPPQIALVSNLTGDFIDAVGPDHWQRHIRSAVRFYDGMLTLDRNGYNQYLELGPNPVLSGLGMQCLPESQARWLISLRRGREDWQQMLESLALLYINGADIDWNGFYKGYPSYRSLSLPTYPFQRERHWKSGPLLPDLLKQAGQAYAQDHLKQIVSENQEAQEKSLDDVCTAYFCNSLLALGAFRAANEWYTPQELEQKLSLETGYRQLLQRWLERLSQKGIVHRAGDRYGRPDPIEQQEMPTLVEKARQLFPDSLPLLNLVQNCGEKLAAVLTGKLDPLSVLFPEGSMESLTALYQDTAFSKYFNGIINTLINRLVSAVANDSHLRILEIGAGTGSTTAAVLPVLPFQRCDYLFTDISELFLQKARAKFADYPFIRYQRLNIEQEISRQGFALQGYDLVIAANVVHATKNLEETMRQVQSLVAPGGLLLLWEIVHPSAWFDLTFGLVLEELQDQDFRQGSPFISVGRWQALLHSLGFEQVAFFPTAEAGSESIDQQVILAQVANAANKAVTAAFKSRKQEPHPQLSEKTLSHPLLDHRLATANPIYEIRLQLGALPYFFDHRVYGQTVFPLSAFLEMAFAAFHDAHPEQTAELVNVSMQEALVLTNPQVSPVLQIVLTPEPDKTYNLLIYSRIPAEAETEQPAWTLHARSKIVLGKQSLTMKPATTLEAVQARCQQETDRDRFYADLDQLGLAYGPSFQGIRQLWQGEQEALARIVPDQSILSETNRYHLHPALLDACFQVLGAAGGVKTSLPDRNDIFMPMFIDSIRLTRNSCAVGWCHATLTGGESLPKGLLIGDFLFYDAAGKPVGEVRGFTCKQVSRRAFLQTQQPKPDQWLYRVNWEASEPVEKAMPALASGEIGNWIIFADCKGVGASLSKELINLSQKTVLVYPGETYEELGQGKYQVNPLVAGDLIQVLEDAGAKGETNFRGIIHLWGLDFTITPEIQPESLDSIQELLCGSVLQLVQILQKEERDLVKELWLVTNGTQSVSPYDSSTSIAASLWGLGRVIANEIPGVHCKRIDLNPHGENHGWILLREILDTAPQSEDEVAYRNHTRYVSRLVRHTVDTTVMDRFPEASYALQITRPGLLEHLELLAKPRRFPAAGEIEIEVQASGLNFRDVMIVMGVYPEDTLQLGAECSGIITAVGEGVTGFLPGDAVMALAGESHSSYVITKAQFAMRKPDEMDFAEAAGLLNVFLSAYYPLQALAGIQKGDKILIHSASGGVGLAAIQIARKAGAEIFVTAGKPFKRDYLKAMGVRYVGDSRSLAFADEILAITGGELLDIVLNTLTGEFIARSFSVLKPGGRFIELGKNNIWSKEQVASLGKNLSYFPIELDRLVAENPGEIGRLLKQLSREFQEKTYLPLPRQVFPVQDAVSAFRLMQQANHIGKIVLSFHDLLLKNRLPAEMPVSATGSYLITGGLGGLGLLLAKWLVDQGAESIVLLGRNAPNDKARRLIAEFQEQGADVQTVQADVSHWEELEPVLEQIDQAGRSLKGVFHCAGVLDDGILLNQNWDRFSQVTAPKILGAWNLHLATRNRKLDHFVLFSSIAALLGTPGQGNHAAANAFMDALAHYRQARGLTALSINWGAWSEVGAAAEKTIDGSLQAKGLGSIAPDQGMALFQAIVSSGYSQLVVVPIKWPDFIKNYPGGTIPSFFSEFRQQVSPKAPVYPHRPVSDLLTRYQQAAGNKRIEVLKEHILTRVAEVLGWKDTASLSCSESFINLGLDSLMAVELKNMISQDLGKLALPDTLLFDQPNCDALVNYLVKKLPVSGSEQSETAESPAIEPALMAQRTGSPEQVSRYPLTHAQQGIWFLYKMNPAMYAFNLTIGLRILSVLNIAILQQTVRDLIARHPVLRTRITEREGNPDQTVLDQVELEIPVVDAKELSDSVLRRLVVESAQKPFVLEQGPLLRVAVFQLEKESILLLVIHHIIFDGASSGIFLDELIRLYSARMAEKPILLQPLGLTFADFVQRQHEMLASERSRRLWDYWHKKLEGELPTLDLPTDFPRPVIRRFRGASHAFVIDHKLTDRIYKLCREEDSTLNMFMVAAFLVLLHRYSGQEDILLGSPVAGRNQPGFEKVLGHFVNLVVIRGNLSGNPGFSDLLKQIKLTVIEALQYQDFPFPLLVEKLNVARDPSRTPVFQAALAFQSGSLGLFKGSTEEEDGKLKGELYPIADQEGEADLTLELFERDRKLTALLKYNPDLFQAATIARMIGHFNMLLESIVTNPLQSLSGLNLLTNEERYLLVEGWQGKKVKFPLEKSIARLFEEQVDKSPGRLAVIFENEQLTYQELNDRSNQLAHHLKESGIEKDSLIGVFLERSLESVVSILAILKTGCVYLPLDPTYPEERIRFMLEDSRTRLILTRKAGKSKLFRLGYRHKTVDLSESGIWRQLTYNPEKFYKPGNLAYVIYTSGSTGKPKGVMVEHPGFVNMIYDQIAGFGITPVDRCLQFAACSFDVSLFEIFMPLLSGAVLVLATTEIIKDGLKLVRYLEEKQVTVAAFTASYLRVLDQNPLPTVTTLIIGGEPSDSDDVLFYCKNKNYFNAYGPTETSVCAAYYQCVLPLKTRSNIPIGKPIANTCLYILDSALNPVPIGVQGEICLAGPGLARGYLNQPELTREAFIPHPFKSNEKLYKTGDIGRWLADGTVEFIGRIDYQVKVRGFRIEIREIENVLMTLPEISNAVVMEQKQLSGENRLVAYLVLKEHISALTTGRLRKTLSAYLPDYMIPSVFHGVNVLPTTSSGKIDRNALRQQHEMESVVAKKTLQPGTQKQLGKIWSEILGKQEISPHDNFFDLGGDSLLAIQIVSRIYKEFNQELPVAVFLQNQTIAELAEFLKQDQIDLPQSALVTIQPNGDQLPFFCVHGAGGNVMCFKALADKMGQDREFVGIQSTRLAHEPDSVRTIESMATAYLQEIRQKQEVGPYIIAGWCMGGCVALEIAQQLRQAEQAVTLILLDSFLLHSRQVNLWLKWQRIWQRLHRSGSNQPSASREPKSDMKLVFNRRFRWNLFLDFINGLVLLNEKPFVLPTKQLKNLELADRITLVTKELNLQGVFTIPIDEDRLLSEFRQFAANIEALLTYVPQPYQDEILLIKAAETYTQKGLWSSHDHGFATISSRLKIKEVPGNHFSILNPPNVDVVAKIINKQLKPIRKNPVEKPPLKRSQTMKNEVSGQKIREIVTLAARTPTGDNCQPFRFAWDGKILAISHVDQRAHHHFNYHDVGSILSLGMLLETIEIIAKSQRLETKANLNLSVELGDKVCAEVEFTSNPDSVPDSLLTAIDQRVTDRRPYKGGNFQDPLFHKIKTDAELFPHTAIYFNNDLNKEILNHICAFETYSWVTKEAHHDVFESIRYSKQETEATRDGMPWQSLGASYLESRVLKLARNYSIQTVLNKLGGLIQIKNLAKKVIRSSAGLGCITITSLKPEDLAEAGRLVIRTWLHLNKNGYGLQPYALCSLVVLSHLMDPAAGHFNPAYKELFDSSKQQLQHYFKIPANEYPCWVFRTGVTAAYPDSMRTLRLPIETIWQER